MSRRLLFVSSGYPDASITGCAIARSLAGEGWEIYYSCDKANALSPGPASVLARHGLTGDCGKSISPQSLEYEQFDIVVTFCDESLELCPTFSGLPAQFHWPLKKFIDCQNPLDEECFEKIFAEIQKRVGGLFDHDITRVLTRLRSTFVSMIDHLADGVMVHDQNRRIFVFNRAAQRITGYNSEEVIGKDCHEVFPEMICGGECPYIDDGELELRKEGYSSQFIDRQGEFHDLQMSLVNIRPPDSNAVSTMLIFRDLTEVNRLRRSLQSTKGFQGIIGYHQSMRKIYRAIEELANENVPVLILGESGTGKELVAEALHRLSRRNDQALVPVNCGALPEGILESELFGHVKGAFTGAISDKKGRFELADKGTLFLDEIGEISPAMQVKLLRVLETKSFVPVGGEKAINTDVRIIAATNKDLLTMTRKEIFREDLYYRLAVYPLTIPPLRERRTDIPLLVDHILDHLGYETGRRFTGIETETMRIIENYDWPGNVRQLINALQYSLIKCRGAIIKPSHLPSEVTLTPLLNIDNKVGRPQKLNQDIVLSTLRRYGGNRAKTARELGVARSTLYRYIP